MMKKIFLSALMLVFTAFAAFSQSKPTVKPNKKQKTETPKSDDNDDNSGDSWGDWGGRRVVGTGDYVKEMRNVSNFTGVSSTISADIELRQGATFKVTVEGQKNILDLVKTDLKDGNLSITFTKGYSMRTKKAVRVYVEAPNFAYIGLAGSGNVTVDEGLKGDNLKVNISGSGNINVEKLAYNTLKLDISGSGNVDLGGTANQADLTISGSGNLKASDLKVKTVNCRISGSGNMSCYVTKEIDALVSGSGDIRYGGNPTSVKTKVSGSGEIQAQ